MNIGQYARNLIKQNPGLKNSAIRDLVLEQFPEAKTSEASIAWYRSDMKKNEKVNVQPVVRTAEMIEAEIEALKAELEEVKIAEMLKMQSEKEELIAKLKAIEEFEAAQAE